MGVYILLVATVHLSAVYIGIAWIIMQKIWFEPFVMKYSEWKAAES